VVRLPLLVLWVRRGQVVQQVLAPPHKEVVLEQLVVRAALETGAATAARPRHLATVLVARIMVSASSSLAETQVVLVPVAPAAARVAAAARAVVVVVVVAARAAPALALAKARAAVAAVVLVAQA
jgi:hypothetical protein